MTTGTNALLEGRVARTALLATAGFTDIEELGRQAARASSTGSARRNPPPLVPSELRLAVPERSGPDGEIEPLDEPALRETVAGTRRRRRGRRGVPALGVPATAAPSGASPR